MTITVINESKRSISQPDLDTFASLLNNFASLVSKTWGINPGQVMAATARSAAWNVCIVDNFPNPAMQKIAFGYHEFVNGQPIAYIRADSYGSRSIFGTYSPALKIKNLTIHGERLTPGVLSIAAHELAEMLIDPQVTHLSDPDGQGRTWLMETCDHTSGSFRLTANNVNGILPDFSTPSFYDSKHGSKPYSYLNVPPAPFTLVKGAYAFYKDAKGTHKVV